MVATSATFKSKLEKIKKSAPKKIFFLISENGTLLFNSPSFPEHSQLCHIWYPTPHCAALV